MTDEDDAYQIAADGWKAELSPVKGKKNEWDSDLLPKQLVINRYFATEQNTIEQLEADRDTKSLRKDEI